MSICIIDCCVSSLRGIFVVRILHNYPQSTMGAFNQRDYYGDWDVASTDKGDKGNLSVEVASLSSHYDLSAFNHHTILLPYHIWITL